MIPVLHRLASIGKSLIPANLFGIPLLGQDRVAGASVIAGNRARDGGQPPRHDRGLPQGWEYLGEAKCPRPSNNREWEVNGYYGFRADGELAPDIEFAQTMDGKE